MIGLSNHAIRRIIFLGSLMIMIGVAQSSAARVDDPPTSPPQKQPADTPKDDLWDNTDAPPQTPASQPGFGPRPRGDLPPGQSESRGRGMGRGEGRGEGRGRGMADERGARAGRGARRLPLPVFMERIIPLLETDHPELAKRLEEIKEESPEQYERLIADALALRLQDALDREAAPHPDAPPNPDAPGLRLPGRGIGRRWDAPVLPEDQKLNETVRALQQHDVELERKTQEITERYRQGVQNRENPLNDEARNALRNELKQIVAQHFEVRTELRRTELRRFERELRRLRDAIERIQMDLDKRETAREIILDRRVSQLLGDQETEP